MTAKDEYQTTATGEPLDGFTRSVHRRLARLRLAARICSALGVIILAAVALVALGTLVAPRFLGLQPYAIISGSMEPAYPTGSLVYVEPATGEQLQAGDVAAFWRDDDVIVHRVQENDPEKRQLVTKGDANAEADVRPAAYEQVLGHVVASVPGAGYFLQALGTTPGKLLVGWVVLMGAALWVIGSVLSSLASRKPVA